MIVVTIIAVSAAIALPRIKTDKVRQGAADLQALLYEAHRQAITLGPVPYGVTDPTGATPDAMVRVVFTANTVTGQYFSVPWGATRGLWSPFHTLTFLAADPSAAQIAGVAPGALYGTSYVARSGTSLAAGTFIELRSDGGCNVGLFPLTGPPTGATIYLDDVANDTTSELKIVLFPLTGLPVSVAGW